MSWSLFDAHGTRKYLTPAERAAFISAAFKAEPKTSSFCLTLALTGARISEALAITPERLDFSDNAIVLETLKRRRRGLYRAIPVPAALLAHLGDVHHLTGGLEGFRAKERLWQFSRPTAWKRVRQVMKAADIAVGLAKPKALRHAFAVEAVQQRIALSVIKKWLGHAKIETTALYADPIGEEERDLARLTWHAIPLDIQD